MTLQQDRNAVGRNDTAGGHNVPTVDDLLVISVRDREIRNQASFTNTPRFVSARGRGARRVDAIGGMSRATI
jgi:hypothetical protein